LPVALVGVYAAALIPRLPAIIAHTWWSADSGSAGVVAQLYSHPAPGQYIILGDHGWYEAFSFDLLTRRLPAHKLLWYSIPVVVWVITIALVGVSAARAFGRYGAGLAIAGLLCLAPVGLMLVFQPTAHTNVVFHAAVLAVVAGWVLPRIRTLPLPGVLGAGVLVGAFTGLAIAGDELALAWAVLPFVVAVGVCAWRGPVTDAARTLAFALVTLTAMLVVAVLFTAIMQSAGIRVDKLAQASQMQFVKPGALVANVGKMVNELGYLVGGSFLGHRIDRDGFLELVSGGTLLLGGAAAVFAVYRAAVAAGERRPGGSRAEVSPKLVHVAFWSTCLTVGLLLFLLSSVGSVDYRYLVGPLVAIAALLPVAAARTRDWRVAVGAGLAVLALAGLYRLESMPLPYLPRDVSLAHKDLVAIDSFAHRHHATSGYAIYWDAVTITWHTNFSVKLYPVKRCGRHAGRYCPLYHADSFTAAYIPRRRLRTLFIFDGRFGPAPVASWGRPIAREKIGRLTVYAYPYDIANRLLRRPGEIRRVITGQAPAAVASRSSRVAELEHR
jgi:hypothetical protein